MAILGATSLTGCSSIPNFIAGGTLMLFQQTNAPVNWTKQSTHNDKTLRVVNGTASSGGTAAFTTVFASRTPAGSISVSGSNSSGAVQSHTLTEAQLPAHAHNIANWLGNIGTSLNQVPNMFNAVNVSSAVNVRASGSSQGHTHPFTNPTWSGSGTFSGTALDFSVQYVDLIIASKD
jgi:microcystin-dependent protein